MENTKARWMSCSLFFLIYTELNYRLLFSFRFFQSISFNLIFLLSANMRSSFLINILIIFAFVIMFPLLSFLSVYPFNHLTIEFSSSTLLFLSPLSLPICKCCYISEWMRRRGWRGRWVVGDDLQLGLKDRGEGRGHPRRGKWEGEGLYASCYDNEIFVLGCQGNFRHTLDTSTIANAPHSLQQPTIHTPK